MRASARRAVLLTAALGAACVTRTRRVAPSGATFVCEQKPKGWRIVHVHSSQILPWDR